MDAHFALDFDRANNLSTGGEYGDPAIMHVPALVPIEPVDVPVSPVMKMMRLAPSVWSDNALKPYSQV